MIRSLRGCVLEVDVNFVLLEVGGIGYRVFLTPAGRGRLRAGMEAFLYTHLHVREDEMALYGFLNPEELGLFESLLTVSGIGPKMALGVVSSLSPLDFHKAVLFEDVKTLTSVPGIGKKTAHRILLELKDRLGTELPWATEYAPGDMSSEALEALVSLGYDRAEALKCLKRIKPKEGLTAEELLKAALKGLGKTGRRPEK